MPGPDAMSGMALDCEIRGEGPPLVMLHGWGMQSGVWGSFADRLACHCRLHLVDLPGHGRSGRVEAVWSLAALAAAVLAVAPAHAAWLGWSLGGMVALQAALDAPERVDRLALIATTPCFAARDGWPHGVAPELIEKLAHSLANDYHATLRHFISLQLRGGEGERAAIRLLRESLSSRGEPDPAALEGGLGLLQRSDLRQRLSSIRQPTVVVSGGRDRLTSPAAAAELASLLPQAEHVGIEQAAHAPFLSHTEATLSAVIPLLCDNRA